MSDDSWASVQECVTRALAAPLAPQSKILLSQRGLQFAEDYSSSIKRLVSNRVPLILENPFDFMLIQHGDPFMFC